MLIRRAVLEDSASLARICQEDNFCAAWSAQDFEKEISNPCALVFTAEEDAAARAFICARFVAPSAEITDFAVSLKYRRRGLGTRLLKNLLEELAAKGVKEVTLEVNSSNAPALALYGQNLFKQASVRKKFYNNTNDALLLKRDI